MEQKLIKTNYPLEMLIEKVVELKKKLGVTIVAHYYQRNEIFDLADMTGDSLELAKKGMELETPLIFCGVKFMGESAKILNPQIPVYMPRLAHCSMAEMGRIDEVERNFYQLEKAGIDFIPVVYINSSARLKGLVGERGGATCTSSSAEKIVRWGLEQGKQVFFLPDRNLGRNVAKKLGVNGTIIGEKGWEKGDIICFNGHCAVHQLFRIEQVEFYRAKIPDIKIVVHPEAPPAVCERADFVGSTSQILKYVKTLPSTQPIAIGTEIHFVNRLKRDFNPNIYPLSSTRAECPSMGETRLEDLYHLLKWLEEKSKKKGNGKTSISDNSDRNTKTGTGKNWEASHLEEWSNIKSLENHFIEKKLIESSFSQIQVDEKIAKSARLALSRMVELTS